MRICCVISWVIFDQQSNVTAQAKISKYVLNEGIEHETKVEKKRNKKCLCISGIYGTRQIQ